MRNHITPNRHGWKPWHLTTSAAGYQPRLRKGWNRATSIPCSHEHDGRIVPRQKTSFLIMGRGFFSPHLPCYFALNWLSMDPERSAAIYDFLQRWGGGRGRRSGREVLLSPFDLDGFLKGQTSLDHLNRLDLMRARSGKVNVEGSPWSGLISPPSSKMCESTCQGSMIYSFDSSRSTRSADFDFQFFSVARRYLGAVNETFLRYFFSFLCSLGNGV